MSEQTMDRVARALAAGTPRRGVLRGLVGALVGSTAVRRWSQSANAKSNAVARCRDDCTSHCCSGAQFVTPLDEHCTSHVLPFAPNANSSCPAACARHCADMHTPA